MKTTSKKGSSTLTTKLAQKAAAKAPAKAKAKIAKKAMLTAAPLAVNRGPAVERPVVPIALRAGITPQVIERIEAGARNGQELWIRG